MGKKRKSAPKTPHLRRGHRHSYWCILRDANGDPICDAKGNPIKEKVSHWLGDIHIHEDGVVPEKTNETKTEDINTSSENVKEENQMNTNVHTTSMGRSIRRGEIYYVKRVPVVGSEQIAGRPAVVVSTEAINATSPTVEVVYLTTQTKKDMPEHIMCSATGKMSTILCEQISTVSVDKIGDYITTLTPEEMEDVEIGMMYSLGLERYISAVDETIDGYYEPVTEAPADIPIVTADTSALEAHIAELEQNYKATAMERDFYKQMYEGLLNKVIK